MTRAQTFFAPGLFSRLAAPVALVLVLSAGSCGPELTTPGDADISGTWHAAGPVVGLTNITMVLQQSADGSLTGTFTAIGSAPNQSCPAAGPCQFSSTLKGANTVLQVNIDLKDAATFTGQVVSPSRLHGTLTAQASDLVDFDRVSGS